MNPLQSWRQLAARIDALSLRERALVMLGAFMVMFLVWDWLLMSGVATESRRLTADLAAVQERVQQLNQSVAAMAQSRAADPNAVLQQRLDALRADADRLDATLAARSSSVIPPAEMARVLEQVLRRQGRLALVSARSLEPQALFDADAANEAPGAVYRHGFELEVEGRYLDVLEYLRTLESLEWQFFWEALTLEAGDYPTNRVRVRVYSLNLEEGWLGV